MDSEERYDLTLSRIVDERDVWILVNEREEFLKIYSEEEDFEYLPIWPDADLASSYLGDGEVLEPKSISLTVFLNKWIAGLERDKLLVGVFPVPEGDVWITEPAELKKDIQEALSDSF